MDNSAGWAATIGLTAFFDLEVRDRLRGKGPPDVFAKNGGSKLVSLPYPARPPQPRHYRAIATPAASR